jgi:hypothetical protein
MATFPYVICTPLQVPNECEQPDRLKELALQANISDCNIVALEPLVDSSPRQPGDLLQLYWVGDGDIYAARCPEEAYELHIGLLGELVRGELTTADVSLVDEISLDSAYRFEDGKPAVSLRKIQPMLTAPGAIDLL